MDAKKIKKIISITIDSLAALLCLLVLILAICTISSKGKGYTNYFGKAYLSVVTGSMTPNSNYTNYIEDGFSASEGGVSKKLAFNAGDVITVKILSEKEKLNLKVGDVVSFKQKEGSTLINNTHRITRIEVEGKEINVWTKGDNEPQEDTLVKTGDEIFGKFNGKRGGGGKFFTFLGSKTGFLFLCVVPSLLIVLYCLVLLVMSLMNVAKEKAVEGQRQMTDSFEAEKEKLKQELMEQMRAQIQNEKPGSKPKDSE